MRVLSFDQSSSKTGWCVTEQMLIEDFGLIDCTKGKKKTTDERFKEMCLAIQNVIFKTQPEIVLIEDTTMQRNPSALKLLSRLQGFIFGVCFNNGDIHIEVIHPSSWRSWIGFKKGKREELKQKAINFCKEELLIKDATEDECESICINFAYCREILKLGE